MRIDGIELLRENELPQALQALEKEDVISIDLETAGRKEGDGLNPFRGQIALVQMYGEKTGTLLIAQTPRFPAHLQEFLRNSNAQFVGHNLAGFDRVFLATHGVEYPAMSRMFDTFIAEQVLVPFGRRNVSKKLGDALQRRLNLPDYKAQISHHNWLGELTQEQIEYAARDVIALPALMRAQLETAAERELERGLEVEMQVAPIVSRMTFNGIPVGITEFEAWQNELYPRAKEAEKRLREYAAENFDMPDLNPRSYKQLYELFERAGKPVQSTNAQTLAQLVGFDGPVGEVARMIQEYREPDQMRKMYKRDWLENFVENDGRVHPSFWQVGTDTGRFSSSNPNAQQFARKMRHVFVAPPGWTFGATDYSQIEIRVGADKSKDVRLLAAVDAEDVHRAIAAEIFKKFPEYISDEERRQAKAIVFGLIFGGSAHTIRTHAATYGATITEEASEDFKNRFFTRFSGLNDWHRKAREICRRHRSITLELPSGLQRQLYGDNLRHTVLLNTSVQGAAAAGIKFGLIEAAKAGLDEFLVAQVHDELDWVVPDEIAEDYQRRLEKAMISGMSQVTDAPVLVETKTGQTWAGGGK